MSKLSVAEAILDRVLELRAVASEMARDRAPR
jgi:hypothetical protein